MRILEEDEEDFVLNIWSIHSRIVILHTKATNYNNRFKRMKKIPILLWACLLVIIQSCSSQEEPISCQEQVKTRTSHLVIKFDNQIYETDVVTVGDSTVYLNQEYAEVYRTKIATNPNVAAVMSSEDDGTICLEYFPNEKELVNSYAFMGLEEKENPTANTATRGGTIDMWPPNTYGTILAVAELYDDRNFKDTRLISYATTTWATAIPRLTELGFNDKCSSIKVFNKMQPGTAYTISYLLSGNVTGFPQQKTIYGSGIRPVLKCFHNSKYSGAVIYCIGTPTGSATDHLDYNLKNIGWNDRISAIAWLLVYDFDAFKGDNPEIPAHGDC